MARRRRLPLVSVLITDTVPFQVEALEGDKKRRADFNKNIVPIANQLMEIFKVDWDRAKMDAKAEFELWGHQLFADRGGVLC